MNFKKYINESQGISFFDIDETLLETKAKIYVIYNNKIIKKLSNKQFNNYQLNPGESFDFREFRDAEYFAKTSKPILPMIKKIQAIFKNASAAGSEVYLLTARADFDNKEKILEYFRGLGVHVGHSSEGKIHIIRAGNLGKTSGEAKKEIIEKFAKTGKYQRIRLYDDDTKNLDKFLELQDEYPYDFQAYLVLNNKSKRYRG